MTRMNAIGPVFVPVSDQERSLEFYVALGFEPRADFVYDGDRRWIEVAPPGAAGTIARGVDVDIDIAREGTPRVGLVSPDVTVENPVPAQFFVRDPDGNRFLIVQPG